MGVKCLAQEHNAVPRPGLEAGPFDPESSPLTIRPPHLPGTGLEKNLKSRLKCDLAVFCPVGKWARKVACLSGKSTCHG